MTPGDLRVSLLHSRFLVSSRNEDTKNGCVADYLRISRRSLPRLAQATTTKCRAGTSYRGENFTPVRNLATVSCKRETTTRFGVKSVCR